MKCLRAVCLGSSSRNRTSEEQKQRVERGQQVRPWSEPTLTSTQRSLQVDQNLVGKDAR